MSDFNNKNLNDYCIIQECFQKQVMGQRNIKTMIKNTQKIITMRALYFKICRMG